MEFVTMSHPFEVHSQNCKKQLLTLSCLSRSLCSHGKIWLPLDKFSWKLIWVFFLICWDNQTFIKIWQEQQINKHFLSYLTQFFLEWEMFQTKLVQKINTYIFCSITIYQKLCHLWDVEKYTRAGQATDFHFEYLRLQTLKNVILLAFPLQQWLHECTSVLHCTYIAFFVL